MIDFDALAAGAVFFRKAAFVLIRFYVQQYVNRLRIVNKIDVEDPYVCDPVIVGAQRGDPRVAVFQRHPDQQQATCVSAFVHQEVYDEDWGVVKARAEKSGNTATGYFTVQQVKLGVTLKTIERTLTLTCDPNGNVT